MTVGVLGGDLSSESLVGTDGGCAYQQHAPRLQATLVSDILRCNVEYADFRDHNGAVVASDEIAREEQATAIKHTVSSTTGRASGNRAPKCSEASARTFLARIQLTLPRSVLISPLWMR